MSACARNMQSDPAEIKPAQCCIKLVFHLTYVIICHVSGSTFKFLEDKIKTRRYLCRIIKCTLLIKGPCNNTSITVQYYRYQAYVVTTLRQILNSSERLDKNRSCKNETSMALTLEFTKQVSEGVRTEMNIKVQAREQGQRLEM